MKYCSHCGAELLDEAVICPDCGCRAAGNQAIKTTSTNRNKILGTIARIWMLIDAIVSGVYGFAMLICTIVMSSARQVIIDSAAFQQLLENSTTEGLTAEILMSIVLIYCIMLTFGSFARLAWCIPMTVSVWRRTKNNDPIGMGLKVCTLLFVDLVPGILLLCMTDDYVKANEG